MGTILGDISKPIFEKPKGCFDLRMRSYGTLRRCFSRRDGTALVVEEGEPKVVGVFVLVPILKCKDLQDGVRENVHHQLVAAVVDHLDRDLTMLARLGRRRVERRFRNFVLGCFLGVQGFTSSGRRETTAL